MHTLSLQATCLDFFAGSGLATEGLKKHFKTIWANDVCPKKAKVYCANHPPNTFHLGSIEKLNGNNLPPAALSWGSFPCQDLSLAGNMGGITDSRSGLVWQWLRVMDEMPQKPVIAVAENVLGLVSASNGEHYYKLHEALTQRGYKVGAVVLDASHWVPQSRKRVFVIAVDQRLQTDEFESWNATWCHPPAITKIADGIKNWVWWNIPEPKARKINLESIIDFELPCDDPQKTTRLLSLIPNRHWEQVNKPEHNNKHVFPGYRRIRNGEQVLELRFDGIAGCLRTPEGGSSRQLLVLKNKDAIRTRLLSIKEAAALMGVRKDYVIPGTYNDAYKAMGDAVAVPVLDYLAKYLLKPIINKTNGSEYPWT